MKKSTILQEFGRRIKNLRKINKMSQEKLAEKADLSTNFVGSLERGEKEPKLITLVKIAQAFDISLAELLNFPDDKKARSVKSNMLDTAAEVLKTTLDLIEQYKIKRKG